jgi:MtN3 and saliva related transmembrane protein
MTEIIGWASSLILLLTLVKQVHKQWKDKTSEGISVFLFTGQITASAGFLVYSILLKNWVFTVTNGLLVINSIFGVVLYFYYRKE